MSKNKFYKCFVWLLLSCSSAFAQPSLEKMQRKLAAEKQNTAQSFYKFELNSKIKTQAGILLSPDMAVQKNNLLPWLADKLALRQGADAFMQKEGSTDYAGTQVSKLQQYYKGIKVEHGVISEADINNKVRLLQMEFYPIPENLITVPVLNEDAALQKAMQFVGAQKYVWQGYTGDDADHEKPAGELVIVEDIFNDLGKMCLAYKFNVFAAQPMSRQYVYVNVLNGKIVFTDAIIKHLANDRNNFSSQPNAGARSKKEKDQQGQFLKLPDLKSNKGSVAGWSAKGTANDFASADTRYSGQVFMATDSVGPGNYRLFETAVGNNTSIHTFNAQNNKFPFPANSVIEFSDNDNNWTAAEYNLGTNNAMLDAHWGAEQVIDYWWTVHGRKSYDNNDGQMINVCHYNINYDNAFWNGTAMFYGDGSGVAGFDAVVALDITAHEIGHAVCQKTCNLVYQRESGALNEALSDIWGACVDNYIQPTIAPLKKKPFQIADEIMLNGRPELRDMANPRSEGQPDTYKDVAHFWRDATIEGCPRPIDSVNDDCRVHRNSGVLNKWFYLITEGDTGTNGNGFFYDVDSMGFAKTEKIAYYTEMILTPNSGYEAARIASLNAVVMLAASPNGVGITAADTVNIIKAWKAVGVMSDSIYNIANTPIFASNDFKSIGVGKYGSIWAGTANNGLYKYDGKTWQKAPVLINHNIADIKTDWNGGIWIGQYGRTGAQAITGGIDYFPDSSFTNTRHWGSFEGIPTRNVRSIFINNDTSLTVDPTLTKLDTFKRVWCAAMSDITAGVSRPGYVARGRQLGASIDTPFKKIALGTDINNGLVQTIGGYDKEVWAFAPNNFGHSQLLRYKTIDTSFIGYVDETNSTLPGGFTAKAIYFDTVGKKWWIGMQSGGVYIYDIVNPGWKQINFPTIFPVGTIVNNNAITGDRKGNIYIGTTNGYVFFGSPNSSVVLNPDSLNQYKRYTTAEGLPSNNVKAIAMDYRAARILLATENGIAFRYLLCKECVNSGPVYSAFPGNWNNPLTWISGEVPGLNANVIVRHDVTVTQDANCNTITVERQGKITVNAGVILNVEGINYIATGRR